MPFLDSIQDAVTRVLPEKKPALPMPMSTTGGIGNAGMLPFEDDVSALLFVAGPSAGDVARFLAAAPGALTASPPRWLRNVHVLSTSHHASMATAEETGGYLVFLLFIPVFSTLWIWVHLSWSSLLPRRVLTRRFARTDDRFKACHHIPCLPILLQLPRYVLLCQRRRLPGEMESWTMCVSRLTTSTARQS